MRLNRHTILCLLSLALVFVAPLAERAEEKEEPTVTVSAEPSETESGK